MVVKDTQKQNVGKKKIAYLSCILALSALLGTYHGPGCILGRKNKLDKGADF